MVAYSVAYSAEVHPMVAYSVAYSAEVYPMVAYSAEVHLMVEYSTEVHLLEVNSKVYSAGVYLKVVCQNSYLMLEYCLVAQLCFRHFKSHIYNNQPYKHNRALIRVLKSFYALLRTKV